MDKGIDYMSNVCIITDSNSGISQEEALTLGIKVIPMPFFIDGVQYYEGINLTQEQFYDKLKNDADISTSQPSVGELQNAFEEALKAHDEAVFIPDFQEHARQHPCWQRITMGK